MALKYCKECGTEVSSSAKKCPKCGKDRTHPVLRGVLLVILIIGVIGAAGGASDETNTTETGTNIVQEQTKMTLEKFNKIETGMTYQQVVDIAGEEGTLSTESSYANQTMKVYYWYASNGISNATVSFMNGKVTAKSQIGLE